MDVQLLIISSVLWSGWPYGCHIKAGK